MDGESIEREEEQEQRISSRMTIKEFKNSYLEINPRANVQNLDADAERK